MWKNGIGDIEKGQWSESQTADYIEFLKANAKNGNIFYKN